MKRHPLEAAPSPVPHICGITPFVGDTKVFAPVVQRVRVRVVDQPGRIVHKPAVEVFDSFGWARQIACGVSAGGQVPFESRYVGIVEFPGFPRQS